MAQQRLETIVGQLGPTSLSNGESSLQPNLTNAKEASQKAGRPSFTLDNKQSATAFDLGALDSSGKTVNFVVLPRQATSKTLTVLDNRTGLTYEVPIEDGTIKATAFQGIKNPDGTKGVRLFDPAFVNTAVCRSTICDIDGDAGILRYRGYPIEELAEKSTFLEVAYLLIYGELPNKQQLENWESEVMRHTFVSVNFQSLMKAFNYDSHPMGMFISSIAAMSTFHPEANPALAGNNIYKEDLKTRNKQIIRLLGKVPTLAASCYRHRIGRPFNNPQNDMSYSENFLYMMDYLSEKNYRPNPKLAKALDILFILHADHELNCSTAAMRHIGSSLVDPYSAVAGASAALYGPLHGGANEAVLRMLEDIGTVDKVGEFLEKVKNRERKLMGFGHRVYKNYDPRAKIIRRVAYEVFDVVGREPLIEVALELEKRALEDPFFSEKKLYPNVDFYSGIIYKAMGFPTDFFPVLFAIPRVAGWLAHWVEAIDDPNAKIWRPRQVYTGETKRNYVALEHRGVATHGNKVPAQGAAQTNNKNHGDSLATGAISHPFSKRSHCATFDRKTKL